MDFKFLQAQKKLKKHVLNFLQGQRSSKSMNLIFCKVKKLKKYELKFFASSKNLKKHVLNFLQAQRSSND
eukprot:UN10003